jgi:hypothetical protein
VRCAAGEYVGCPGLRGVCALAESARADVDNNLFAALFVGSLALVAAVIFMVLDRRREHDRRFSWLAFLAAAAVLVVGWVAYWWYRDGVVHNAHWVAALSLFGCIFVVAFENARRRQGSARATGAVPPDEGQAPGVRIPRTVRQINARSVRRSVGDLYTWIATALLVIGVISVVAWWRQWITLFWLEIMCSSCSSRSGSRKPSNRTASRRPPSPSSMRPSDRRRNGSALAAFDARLLRQARF